MSPKNIENPPSEAAAGSAIVCVEVRDSRAGYFIPVRYGIGVWPDEKIVGAWSPSQLSAVSLGYSGQKTIMEGFPKALVSW